MKNVLNRVSLVGAGNSFKLTEIHGFQVFTRLEGYDSLVDKLEALMDRTEAENLKAIYLQAAMVVRDRAKMLAPNDPGRKKGYHLRDAIFAAPGKPEKANALVGVNSNWRSARPNAPHAHIIEHGTAPRMTKAGKFTGVGPAHPFLRPAIVQSKAEVARIVLDGIRKEVLRPLGG